MTPAKFDGSLKVTLSEPIITNKVVFYFHAYANMNIPREVEQLDRTRKQNMQLYQLLVSDIYKR